MKADLEKAFDFLDLGYVRLVLHKSINPHLADDDHRHNLKGCSLSSVLFILGLDGLCLHISNVVATGLFYPLRIRSNIWISHIFFVYDMLTMGLINRFVWLHYFKLFYRFGNPTGLKMNQNKLVIICVKMGN